eukprot:s5499_g2.t1
MKRRVCWLLCFALSSSEELTEGLSSTVSALSARVAQLRSELQAAEEALAQARAEEDADLSLAPWEQPAVCNARMRTSHLLDASVYLTKQHALRAPFYIKAARKSFQKGLKQQQGIDKSNSDPFIKQHEGQLQVLGALDLAPDDPEIWLEAAKVSLSLASLGESEGPPEWLKINPRTSGGIKGPMMP